ncbi:MAG TPA: hypothetical protein VFA07_01780 [Chthonomonadaceae bacterium]|nr:hypothetical protein [Chthonomonadaceae bacterium]
MLPLTEVFETDLLAISDLAELLGVLDYICAECAKNAPHLPPPASSIKFRP